MKIQAVCQVRAKYAYDYSVEAGSDFGILVCSRREGAAHLGLALEQQHLHRFAAQELMGRDQVLQGDEARGASPDYSNFHLGRGVGVGVNQILRELV